MDPKPQDRKLAEKMNALLRQELGHPVYSWQWSEEVVVSMRDVTCGYDYKADPNTGLLVATPRFITRPVTWPRIFDQWILCKKLYMEEREWLKRYSRNMLWPENGEWHPCEGPMGYVALGHGVSPDKDKTWKVIEIVRESRSVTKADFEAKFEREEAKREKEATDLRRDVIRDALPAFGGVPGAKGDYSFGGFDASKTENEANQ